jgi:hypothetical protein
MAFIAAKRIAVVAAMSSQQTPAAERAVAHALKDVWTKVEAAVLRAGRTKPVSACNPLARGSEDTSLSTAVYELHQQFT